MKTVDELKEGDVIAFEWNTHDFRGNVVIVDGISISRDGSFLCHFLDGYKSEAEWVKQEDVLAIGNMNGKHRIKGWTGRFDIIKPDHPLMVKNAYLPE